MMGKFKSEHNDPSVLIFRKAISNIYLGPLFI